MDFKPLPVPPADTYKPVTVQKFSPLYQAFLDAVGWWARYSAQLAYDKEYPIGNADDQQTWANNQVIGEGNRAAMSRLDWTRGQIMAYNLNEGTSSGGALPVPAPLPAQSFFYVAAVDVGAVNAFDARITGGANVGTPKNVKPWKPSDAFGGA